MKFVSISISNFKGIENESLKFNPSFTVLVGKNGSGKSSILDALSIGLGAMLFETKVPYGIDESKTRPILDSERRQVMESADNIEVMDASLEGLLEFDNENHGWFVSTTSNQTQRIECKSLGLNNILKGDSDIKNLPLMVYDTTSRLTVYPDKENEYEKIGSRFDGYYACLDPRSIKKQFISWFKTFEDAALKFDKDKSLYHAFTNAITSMVPEWTDIKFNWGLDDLVGKLPDGKWMPLSSLSDGYKGVIGLAAYIAYRAIKLNPHLGENAVTETKGIVLIDEIDLHLHPKWQKTIVTDLKKTFPQLQFIVSTHSPFILQSLKADEVINLDGEKVDEDFTTMDIKTTAAFMGVESNNSNEFSDKEELAKNYISTLQSLKSVKAASSNNIEDLQALIDKSTDPVFKAKMEIEKLTYNLKK